MKKTQLIELLHTIGKTWVSFFSIVMFVTLGAGLYLGLNWSGMAIESASDKLYDSQSFHDFDISYVYGITQEDTDDIAAIDGVSQIEGGYTAFATFSLSGQGHVARILSENKDIDLANCLEGSMPEKSDEIAVDSTFARNNAVKIGDRITFDSDGTDDGDGMKYLNGRTYTVTAIISQPAYIVASSGTRGMTNLSAGAADCFMVLPTSAFDTSAYDGCYSNVYVRCDSLNNLSTFTGAYSLEANNIQDELTALGETDGNTRYQSLHDAAQAKIDDGQKQLDDATQQIADAEAQIADGENQIADAEAQIADGEAQAADAEEQLSEAKDQLDSYQYQADVAQAKLDGYMDTATLTLMAAGVPGTYDEISNKLYGILDEAANSSEPIDSIARRYGIPDQYIAQYVSKAQSYLDQYRDFLDKKQQLADGWDEYYSSRATLDDKEAQLEDAKAQLEDKKTQIADAKVQLEQKKAELADAKVQLQTARDQLAEMTPYNWNISGRSSNASVIGVTAYYDSTNRLRYSMALVFLVVGLFVCYTAMSRIVREQVVSIGTKKALGLRSKEITLAYLLYAALAVIIGIILAVLVAIFLIESIINASASSRFVMDSIPAYASFKNVAFIGLVELGLICLATWLACRRMLHRQAIDLLKGEEPPKTKTRFYEKWKSWERMPLYSQSIVNNFFNDKIRVIGTLIGVAGCTALVVIAMTMYCNIGNTFTRQYDAVYNFDAHVSVDSTKDGVIDETISVLDDAGANSAAVLSRTLGIDEPDGTLGVVTLEVPDDAASFSELFRLRSIDGSGEGQLDDQGVWVSQAYATHQHAKVGDTITLMDSSGTRYEVPIAGIFEYHLNHHEVVMSKGLYSETFGEDASPNTVLIGLNGADSQSLSQKLSGVDGFFSYTNDYDVDKANFEAYQSLTRTVVYIYLGLSALMAAVVLMNLTVMFIEEKKRDLIVLRINGFSVHDAKSYIYRDNIALTIVGIILGVLLGMLMGYLSLISLEFDAGCYIHTPSLIACLAGVGVSAFFALVINLIALRRIPRFNLTDINKM